MPFYATQQKNAELTYERCESFGGGMDAFTRSTLLGPDQFQYAENINIPDNFGARTRAGADKLGATFAAKIQGAIYFDIPGTEQLIVAANQAFSYWNGSAWTSMAGWTLADASLAFSAAQGVDKVLFTDGSQELRTWDGANFSAALGTANTDPPKGATILLWHAGRMWAAGFAGSVAGKEDDAIWGSALLAFGTGQWDGTDRNFRAGGGEGDPITYLGSLSASADKGYVMAVGKQNSIWLVNTDPTATVANYSAGLGPQRLSDGIGIVGKRAACVFGNDLLFVSPDRTFRSLARMESAAGQYQLSAPLSLPIQPYVDRINWTYAHLIAVKKYRELALFSVPLDSAIYPDTTFVWNGRLQRWVSIWTGWTPNCWEVTRFAGVTRSVHGDNSGNVRMWKDTDDAADDDTYLDDGTAITTKLWLRSMLFGEPLNEKDAFHCEARFNTATSNGVVTFTAVADNSDLKTWTGEVRRQDPTLPVVLPFTLATPTNLPIRRGLRGLSPWNELYLKLESTSGYWDLRNVSLSAFVNPLRHS